MQWFTSFTRSARKETRRVILGVMLIASASCSGQADGDVAADLQEWTIRPSLRIGSVDDENFTFARIDGIIPTSDGLIYVLDGRKSGVFVYDSSGSFVRRIGRAGTGPGELQGATGIGLLGDSIWVSDPRQNRITFFSGSGNLLHTLKGSASFLLKNGSMVGTTGMALDPVADLNAVRQAVTVRNRSEAVLDTIAELPVGPFVFRTNGGGFLVFSNFADSPIVKGAVDGTSYVVVDRKAATGPGEATFQIRAFDANGASRFDRAYSYKPTPLPSAVVDSLIRERAAEGTVSNEELREKAYLPDFAPPITGVVIGSDGAIWLRREESFGPEVSWNVLDADGNPVGEFAAPSRLDIHAVNGDTIWGAETDDLDVSYVVRYELSRPGD